MKYYRKKRTTKRRYVPRRRRPMGAMRRRTATISRVPGRGPFADKMSTKVRYSELISFGTGSLTPINVYVFRGNGVYDPNRTGTGDQPLGHDQYSALYEKFLVRGSAIKLTMTNNTVVPTVCAVVAKNTSTTPSVWDVIYEKPYSRVATVLSNNVLARPPMIKMYFSTKKMLGLGSVKAENSTYVGTCTSSDPVDQWYWHICVGAFDQNSLPATNLTIRVDLTYYVTYFSRLPLPES